MNIDHLSVSRTQLFHECPQKYKFKYHLKVPVDEPEQPYFLYGKVVHKIMEQFVVHKAKKPLSKITDEVLKGKILLEQNDNEKLPPIKALPKEYLNKITEHLKAFTSLCNRIGTDGFCEWNFNYDLDPPYEKFVYGFIDRIVTKNDNTYIFDYKTTKQGFWRKGKHNITDDLQLRCYAMVVSKHFGVPANKIKTALCYLDGSELVGARFSQKTLEDTEKELLEIYNEIAELEPEKARGHVGTTVVDAHIDRYALGILSSNIHSTINLPKH